MSYNANELAIILTREIEQVIHKLCYDITKVDEKSIKQSPNFYMIRCAILTILEKYTETLYIESSESPIMINEMPANMVKEFKRHQLKKEAAMVVEKIVEPTSNITNCEFSAIKWDATSVAALTLIAQALIEQAKTSQMLIELFKSQHIQVESLIKVVDEE